jgi:hypothetical protein
MELETKIKKMRRFSKDLSALAFVVSTKNNEAVIKFRKKYVLVKCPDKNIADELCGRLNNAMVFSVGRFNEIIDLLDKKCEQLTCFTRDNQPIPQGEADNGEAKGLGNSQG